MKISPFGLIVLSVILLAPFFSSAQKLPCLTHGKTNEILANSPEKQALLEQLEREAQEYTAEHYGERGGGVKVIPTVIHIVHDNGSENLSKEDILSTMEYVNEELRGQNANLSSVAAAFQGIIADTEFELRLAKIDDQGNCTDGITRTVSNQTYSADEDIKDVINWNDGTRRYLQVWLVNTVGSGAGGYTYLPGTTNARRNGIIIRAGQFQGSLAHEFGHWMNLRHTWGGTNEPEVASNCFDDDGVNDTPNTEGTSGGCNAGQETCGSLDNVHNHMDYTSCARMFTLGQAARMQSASNSSTGGRSTYWGASNRSATGTSDGFTNVCTPNVEFNLENNLGCEGIEVEFQDNSWGADVDASWVWTWSFPGGTPSTSNDINPTIVYNTAGTYDVTLTISTGAGTESETLQDAVVVTQLGGGIAGAWTEGAEDSDFPENSNPDFEWSVESPGGLTWQRGTSASFSGEACARINLRSVTEGNVNSLISPPIDMTNVESGDASMTFQLAHSNRTSTSHSERLRIYASKNCGESWTIRYTETGDNLNTAGGLVTSTFVPDQNDWRMEEVSLSSMAGESHVLIKFEALSDRQSYLYIDDININPDAGSIGIDETGVFTDVKVYPNPVNGNSQLELNLEEPVDAEVSLLNVVGQTLGSRTTQLNAGLNRIPVSSLNTSMSAGIYFIRLSSEAGTKTVRFVKN